MTLDRAAARATDWPLYWFASLDAGLTKKDIKKIQHAIRQLDRLGIEVRFKFPWWNDTEPVLDMLDAKDAEIARLTAMLAERGVTWAR